MIKFISIILMGLVFGIASSAHATKGRVNQFGCHIGHYHFDNTRIVAGRCHNGRPVDGPRVSTSTEKRLIRIEKKLDRLLKQSRRSGGIEYGTDSRMNVIKAEICRGFLKKYNAARYDSTRTLIYNQLAKAGCLK